MPRQFSCVTGLRINTYSSLTVAEMEDQREEGTCPGPQLLVEPGWNTRLPTLSLHPCLIVLSALDDHLRKQTNSCLATIRMAKGMEEHRSREAPGPLLKGDGQITAVPIQQAPP